MKTKLLSLLLLPCLVTSALAASLKISLEANGEPGPVILLGIQGDNATAHVGDETEEFNLQDMSWLEGDTGNWISLTQSQAFVEQSRARTLQTLKTNQTISLELRPFLLWALNPTFNITRTNGTLRLTSGQVDYIVQGTATTNAVDKFFRYAVLNAYKKSITERKLPPYSELKAIEEMKKLGHVPRSISIHMPGIPKAPTFKMEIHEDKTSG